MFGLLYQSEETIVYAKGFKNSSRILTTCIDLQIAHYMRVKDSDEYKAIGIAEKSILFGFQALSNLTGTCDDDYENEVLESFFQEREGSQPDHHKLLQFCHLVQQHIPKKDVYIESCIALFNFMTCCS